jgi:hypothetical protein
MITRRRHALRVEGFMMLELLLVVAIILVLFVLYWGGGLGGKASHQKDFAACSKNLQFIHTALMNYAADNNDRFPSIVRAESAEAPLSLLIPKATSQTAPFICPSSGDRALKEGESFATKKISYAYLTGLTRASDPAQFVMSDEQVNTNQKPAGANVFATTDTAPGNNHGGFGGNLLLLDGSVQTIAAQAPAALMFTNATLLNPRPKPRKG